MRAYCEVIFQPPRRERERVCAVLPDLLHLGQRSLRRLQRVVGVDREAVHPSWHAHGRSAGTANGRKPLRARTRQRAHSQDFDQRLAEVVAISAQQVVRPALPLVLQALDGAAELSGASAAESNTGAASREAAARARLRRADGRDTQRNALAERVVRVALRGAAVHLRSPGRVIRNKPTGKRLRLRAGTYASAIGAVTKGPLCACGVTAVARVSAARQLQSASALSGPRAAARSCKAYGPRQTSTQGAPRTLAADLHGAVKNAAQAKGVAREAVERLDRLVCVRVRRVGDVIHCAREHARRVSDLRLRCAAHGPRCGAGRAQQPTRAARARRRTQARWNLRRRTSPRGGRHGRGFVCGRAPVLCCAARAASVGCCAPPAPAHDLYAAPAVRGPLTRRARSLVQYTTSPTRQTRTQTRRSRRSTVSRATPLAWAASFTAPWRSAAKARRLTRTWPGTFHVAATRCSVRAGRLGCACATPGGADASRRRSTHAQSGPSATARTAPAYAPVRLHAHTRPVLTSCPAASGCAGVQLHPERQPELHVP